MNWQTWDYIIEKIKTLNNSNKKRVIIKLNCTQNQNSKNRVYSKDFKLQTINRILINHEFINSIAIDIGSASDRILDNWLSKFKENEYNVIEKRNEI